jgi:SAM-dependent methyltransferase
MNNEIHARSEQKPAGLAEVLAIQGTYQPIYGHPDLGDSARAELLRRNCRFVADHYAATKRKQQVRIIDIGCNAGFTTLTLAETFPSIVGYEILPDHLKLCRYLAAETGSPATFQGDDIFAADTWVTETENIDCALLFNVIHQLIIHRGLPWTQMVIARLVNQVDVLFIELARRDEYPKHSLPADPAEALKLCTDAEITPLADTPRPLYKVTRRTATVGHLRIQPQRIDHSGNPHAFISRKYYWGVDTFMKVYRLNKRQLDTNYWIEVRAMEALQEEPYCPRIINWTTYNNATAILMERVDGPTLLERLPHLTGAEKLRYSSQILKLHASTFPKIGYHNDISPHNLIIRDGQLVLVDYEQSIQLPIVDPYAALLWTLTDIWLGADMSYKKDAITSLSGAGRRAPPSLYPSVVSPLEAITESAHASTAWGAFVEEWAGRPF